MEDGENPELKAGRARPWVNWALALLTAPGAAIVMAYALGAVMSTAVCTDRPCPDLGPNGISWGVVFYGPPVVAALTIAVSFVTAGRRRGILVPLGGWALLIVDAILLATTVQQ